MRSTAIWTTVIASSFGLALAAQSTMGTGTLPQAGNPGARAPAPTTMTGCLQRVDQAGHYKLTNTTLVTSGEAATDAAKSTLPPSGAVAGAATPPSSGAVAGAATPPPALGPRVDSKEFTLVTRAASIRFDEHVGHTVEVIGNLQQAVPAGTSGAMETPAATGTAGTPANAPRPQGTLGTQTLDVSTLRMIAKNCK